MNPDDLEPVLKEIEGLLAAGHFEEAESRLRSTDQGWAALEHELQNSSLPAKAFDVERLRRAERVLPHLRIDALAGKLPNLQGFPEPLASFFARHAALPLTPSVVQDFSAELESITAAAKNQSKALEALAVEIDGNEARTALLARFVLLFRLQYLAEAKPEVFTDTVATIACRLAEFRPLAAQVEFREEKWRKCEQTFGVLLDALANASGSTPLSQSPTPNPISHSP
jgi:hypothetical protein